MPVTTIRGLVAAASLAAAAWTSPAAAAVLSVGPYTPSTTAPFVVPIVVDGALALDSWTFDLAFDPTDIAINTGCDPFAGNVYCDLLTGPITPGAFYAGAVFPALFVPGFVLLDGLGEQLGLLLAVAGAWQDPGPAPSGSGILAFVEFVTRPGGTGGSPITIVGTPPNAVPEPAPIALLCLAFAVLSFRRRDRSDR